MKKVLIYSTAIGTNKTIETEATTFGELLKDLSKNDVAFIEDSMKAIVGQTRVTLESSNAVLPTEDFTLFLMPVKTKSGLLTRQECFAIIAEHKAKFPEAKKYYGNQTQISTDDLNELIENNPFGKKQSTKNTKIVETAEKVLEKVLEKVKEEEQLVNLCNSMIAFIREEYSPCDADGYQEQLDTITGNKKPQSKEDLLKKEEEEISKSIKGLI